ncbi:DNA-directed RNA polymerase subunit beta' [Candidatus Dojkabacteria bacterium]|nr:DNA-directed RNA polymerase subunit beta' [Candidatus Dojkabacteria bacterium]
MLDLRREIKNFDAIKILLASPEDILRWSHGEVTKPETINYRTGRAEVDGLMCEKIFGPVTSYQCYCGKYRKARYKGIVCDKCGVEVTKADVRRERMGHIKLVIPVVHVWYAHSIPSKLSIILDISQKDLRSVIYYTRFIITTIDETRRADALKLVEEYSEKRVGELKEEEGLRINDLEEEKKSEIKALKKQKLDKEKYTIQEGLIDENYKRLVGEVKRDIKGELDDVENEIQRLSDLVKNLRVKSIITDDEHSLMNDAGIDFYSAMIGAEAVEHLLKQVDLAAEEKMLKQKIVDAAGRQKANDIRRLKYITSMIKNKVKPEWMIVHVIPVIPPDLRPIIGLTGGRYAVSDLNDLYRRVINRNNRLKRLIEINAPEVILRNEKRMLQESIDSLIDNAHTPHKPVLNSKRIAYKSLTDQLRGKKGRFRRNLLGKRVDYSGRAVITGDPTLSLYECGIPKVMALELFKPFIIHELIDQGHAINVHEAKRIINDEEVIVWDTLEKILKDRPVLLNRPPTLHKQSLQGFYVKLVEGSAIRFHPLVCGGYNADFDGDQMGVFVPLTDEAVEEIKTKMLTKYNILKLANGESVISLSKDMVWGVYYITQDPVDKPKRVFADTDSAVGAFEAGFLGIRDPVVTETKAGVIETTVGRVLFNEVFPNEIPYINELMNKRKINNIIAEFAETMDPDLLVSLLDGLKNLSFKYATVSGFTIGKSDLTSYQGKLGEIDNATKSESEILENYEEGLITQEEKERLIQELWLDTTENLANKSWEDLQKNVENSVYMQIEAKLSGTIDNLKQVVAIKGLVRDPSGKWVNLPIKSNYTDGLSVFEFFVAARGGRKGLADTALRTADSGYLTRKLVDVSHTSIVRMDDCGYSGEGVELHKNSAREIDYYSNIKGRTVAEDIVDPKTKKVILKKNEVIDRDIAKFIDQCEKIESIKVRSPLLCESPVGLCQKCYGSDIGTGKLVEIGKAVGVIASQSVGEASTQMTLRTFHFGGSKVKDITQGVPKLVELFEVRNPKFAAKLSSLTGKVSLRKTKATTVVEINGRKQQKIRYIIEGVKEINVKDGDNVKKGEDLFKIDDKKKVIAVMDGEVFLSGDVLTLTGEVSSVERFRFRETTQVIVKDGDKIKAGDPITEGNIPPKDLFDVTDIITTQKFIIEELQRVYKDQGIEISDKHLEVLVRQMSKNALIIHPGDSDYVIGEVGDKYLMKLKNEILMKSEKRPIVFEPLLIGVTASSLRAEGILSALSFQEQVRVLTDASLKGTVDHLVGFKENVIIGRLIPTGEDARIKAPEDLPYVKGLV